MMWGKILGAGFGFIFGGIFGALFGAYVGHNFDRGIGQSNFGFADPQAVQDKFFSSLFQNFVIDQIKGFRVPSYVWVCVRHCTIVF